MPPSRSPRLHHLISLALLAVIAAVCVYLGWVGFIGSDDALYAAGARGWLTDFPYLGDTHWALRHTFVLPVALSFWLFGEGEMSLGLVSLLYYFATLAVTYLLLARHFNARQSFLAGLIFVTTPVFVIWSSIPGPDIAEAFFVITSIYLFDLALDEPGKTRLFFLAGIAAGLAWLTRETSLGLVLLYGIFFLIGVGGQRGRYAWIALGFVIIAVGELAWYWRETGDPLYRLWIDLDQGRSKGAHLKSRPVTQVKAQILENPFYSIFLNQNFGVLFYLAIPASLWALRGKTLDSAQYRLVLLLVALLVGWFLTIGFLLPVRGLSRYFEVAVLASALLTGLWIAVGIPPISRGLAAATLLLAISANLTGIYINNREPLYGERILVSWVEEHREPVYTDIGTANRAEFLLATRGLRGYLRAGPPPAGGVYLHNPNSPRTTQPAPAGWTRIERHEPERKFTGHLVAFLGLDRLLPPWIVHKLNSPNQPVLFLRRPEVTAN